MPRQPKKLADSKFCQNVRRIRKERDMSQEELGRLCGMTYKMITGYETGANLPSIEQAVAIARALGKSMDELCETEQFKRKEEKRA